jgi:hypothetical protein
MMHCNDVPRREAWNVGQHMIPRGRDRNIDAEGATAPDTLRQMDREGDDLLESSMAGGAVLTEGVTPNSIDLRQGEISQVH